MKTMIHFKKGLDNHMEKNYNFINDNYKIDFEIPEALQKEIEYLEELDRNNDYAFYNYAEDLEYSGRYFVKKGIISKKQWIQLCNRYGGF